MLCSARARYRQVIVRTLLSSTVLRVDPEPSADAFAVRARGHASRDGELGEARPHAGLVDTEHGKVLGLRRVEVVLVSDGQSAALDVVDAGRVVFARWAAGARVVAVADIAALGRCKEVGRALVAADLGRDVRTSR